MNFFHSPGKNWRLQPFPPENFSLYFYTPPNFIHRLMQRLILGFRWRRE